MVEDQSSYIMNCQFLKARDELPQRRSCVYLCGRNCLSAALRPQVSSEKRRRKQEEKEGDEREIFRRAALYFMSMLDHTRQKW